MAIVSLYNNNKNQFRKYPIKQGSSCMSLSREIVPDSLIVNCSISANYGNHRIYISQIFIKNSQVNITISSVLDGGSFLGKFTGTINTDFTTLKLESNLPNISGSLTIGTLKDIAQSELVWLFEPSALEFEESVIFCYPAPPVSSISDKDGTKLTGFVLFGELTNVAKTTVTNNLENIKKTELASEFPEEVFNLSDKSSYLDNCPNPIILSINGVVPSYIGDTGENSKNDGNIYFVGVEPIKFYGIPSSQPGATNDESEDGFIGIDTGDLNLINLCKTKKLLVPTDITGFSLVEFVDQYYSKPALVETQSSDYPFTIPARAAGNFNSTKKPEFYFWPQFVRQEYYTSWPTPIGATGAT